MMTGAERELLEGLLARHPSLADQRQQLETGFSMLCGCFSGGGKLLLCGNGGSASDALHIVGELMKSFRLRRPVDEDTASRLTKRFGQEGASLSRCLEGALPAIALVENAALSTAFGNDAAPVYAFAQQVYGLGQPGDCLLGISTSGNAENVCAAAAVAGARGMRVLGLTGASGGKLAERCDCCIRVPETETYLVQELHLPVYHTLCAMLEAHFFRLG